MPFFARKPFFWFHIQLLHCQITVTETWVGGGFRASLSLSKISTEPRFHTFCQRGLRLLLKETPIHSGRITCLSRYQLGWACSTSPLTLLNHVRHNSNMQAPIWLICPSCYPISQFHTFCFCAPTALKAHREFAIGLNCKAMATSRSDCWRDHPELIQW